MDIAAWRSLIQYGKNSRNTEKGVSEDIGNRLSISDTHPHRKGAFFSTAFIILNQKSSNEKKSVRSAAPHPLISH